MFRSSNGREVMWENVLFLGMCPEAFRGDDQDACSLLGKVQKYTHTYLERDRKQMWQNADSW